MYRELEKEGLPVPEFRQQDFMFYATVKNRKPDLENEKVAKESKKVNLEKILLETKISNIMHNHIINIFDELDYNQVFGRKKVMEITGCGKTQTSEIMNVMKNSKVIMEVKGKGRGKYIFKVEE